MNGPSAAATAKRGVVRFLRDGGDRRAARCAGARAVGSAHNRKPILTDGSRWPFRPPCWQRSAIGPERTIEKTRLMSLRGCPGRPNGTASISSNHGVRRNRIAAHDTHLIHFLWCSFLYEIKACRLCPCMQCRRFSADSPVSVNRNHPL